MSDKTNCMTREEINLLLYFETRAVDYNGRVDTRHMKGTDFDIAEKWSESGFVSFGRIAAADCEGSIQHWCRLSSDAYECAASARRERAERSFGNKFYRIETE